MRAPDMPRGWPTAMAPPLDVDLGGVEAEFAGGGDPDGGECFVDFDEVEVGGVDAFLRAGFGDGPGGLGLEGGVGSGDDAVGADFRDPGQAEFFGLGFAHHHDGGGAVGDRGGGAGGDGAVLAERGTQFAEGFGGGVGADASSWAKTMGSPLRWGMETGTTSLSNRPSFQARAAFWCEAAAKASCSARVMWAVSCWLTCSVSRPMAWSVKMSWRPS